MENPHTFENELRSDLIALANITLKVSRDLNFSVNDPVQFNHKYKNLDLSEEKLRELKRTIDSVLLEVGFKREKSNNWMLDNIEIPFTNILKKGNKEVLHQRVKDTIDQVQKLYGIKIGDETILPPHEFLLYSIDLVLREARNTIVLGFSNENETSFTLDPEKENSLMALNKALTSEDLTQIRTFFDFIIAEKVSFWESKKFKKAIFDSLLESQYNPQYKANVDRIFSKNQTLDNVETDRLEKPVNKSDLSITQRIKDVQAGIINNIQEFTSQLEKAAERTKLIIEKKWFLEKEAERMADRIFILSLPQKLLRIQEAVNYARLSFMKNKYTSQQNEISKRMDELKKDYQNLGEVNRDKLSSYKSNALLEYNSAPRTKNRFTEKKAFNAINQDEVRRNQSEIEKEQRFIELHDSLSNLEEESIRLGCAVESIMAELADSSARITSYDNTAKSIQIHSYEQMNNVKRMTSSIADSEITHLLEGMAKREKQLLPLLPEISSPKLLPAPSDNE